MSKMKNKFFKYLGTISKYYLRLLMRKFACMDICIYECLLPFHPKTVKPIWLKFRIEIISKNDTHVNFYLENIHGSREIIEKLKFKRAAPRETACNIIKALLI